MRIVLLSVLFILLIVLLTVIFVVYVVYLLYIDSFLLIDVTFLMIDVADVVLMLIVRRGAPLWVIAAIAVRCQRA
jgi:hypothetical protein